MFFYNKKWLKNIHEQLQLFIIIFFFWKTLKSFNSMIQLWELFTIWVKFTLLILTIIHLIPQLIFNYETKNIASKTLSIITIFNLEWLSPVKSKSKPNRIRVGELDFYEVQLRSVSKSDSDYIIEFGVGYYFFSISNRSKFLKSKANSNCIVIPNVKLLFLSSHTLLTL